MTYSNGPIGMWGAQVNSAEVLLVDDVMKLEAQAIACYSSTALTLYSVVAQNLIERGGQSIRSEAAKYRSASVGDVITLPGGRLKSNYVLAAVTNTRQDMPTLPSIGGCIATLIQRAAGLGLQSLAIPLMRMRRRLDLEDILRATLAPVIDHLCSNTSLRQVYIGIQGEFDPTQSLQLVRYLEAAFKGLVALGEARARLAALEKLQQQLSLFEGAERRFNGMILREKLRLQRQIRDLLEREHRRLGGAALRLELDRLTL